MQEVPRSEIEMWIDYVDARVPLCKPVSKLCFFLVEREARRVCRLYIQFHRTGGRWLFPRMQRSSGEGSKTHSPCFFYILFLFPPPPPLFYKRRSAPAHQFHFSLVGQHQSIAARAESWDDCGRAFPGELCVRPFPGWVQPAPSLLGQGSVRI